MKRAAQFIFISWLAIMGTITVLATSPWVDSNPYLFSVIKTDTSKNNTVTVVDNTMIYSFGAGADGQVYGFQPHSTYYYHDVVRVQSCVQQTIRVWYTLEGGLAELYDQGILQLGAEGAAGERWLQHEPITVEAGHDSGAIDFYFVVPPDQPLMDFSGSISIHARVE